MKRRGYEFGVLAGLLAFTLACDDDPTGPSSLAVVPDTLEAIGDFAELQARVVGGSSNAPRWTSLDPTILSVGTFGVARALAAGDARVEVTLDGRTAQGTITVLPQTDVRIASATLTGEPDGKEKLTLRLRNQAGRGFFRLQMYRDGVGGAPAETVSFDLTERSVDHGLDATFQTWFTPPAPDEPSIDFVIVVSRGAHEAEARQTECVRLDGAPCAG